MRGIIGEILVNISLFVLDVLQSGETAGTMYLEGSGCEGMDDAPVQEV